MARNRKKNQTEPSAKPTPDFISLLKSHIDEFQSIKEENEKLKQDLKNKEKELNELKETIENLKNSVATNDAGNEVSDLETLKQENEALKRELGYYQKLKEAILELEPTKS